MEILGSPDRGLSSGPPWFLRIDILLGIGWKGTCRCVCVCRDEDGEATLSLFYCYIWKIKFSVENTECV